MAAAEAERRKPEAEKTPRRLPGETHSTFDTFVGEEVRVKRGGDGRWAGIKCQRITDQAQPSDA